MDKDEIIELVSKGDKKAFKELVRQLAGGRDSFEHERLEILATLKSLNNYKWDSLGQYILLEFVAGSPDSDVSWPVVLTAEAAEQVLIVLAACLAEKPLADKKKQ